MCQKIKTELGGFLKASYPLVYIQSSEEERVERIVGEICNATTSSGDRMCDLFVWAEGVGIQAGHKDLVDNDDFDWAKIKDASNNIALFILQACKISEESVEAKGRGESTKWDRAAFLAKDIHYLFANPNPMLYRQLKIFAQNAKLIGQSIIAIGPPVTIPVELKHEFVIIDCDLPDKKDILRAIKEMGESLAESGDAASAKAIEDALETEGDMVVDAAKGMTEADVIGSAALSLVHCGKLDREFITAQKVQAIKKSGCLEVWPAEEIGHVGGLDELKKYLSVTSRAFSKEAREFGLKEPRGILAVGVPGTGKSLTAKAAASVFNRPLIRFDVGSVFGSLMGDSEKNMREAIKTAEAAAPCVLFIDEIEKAFAGSGGGSLDGGTSVRVFGTFLSWMQDHKSEVYVIATANQVHNLPPELLRKGRFDEIFFSDLPTDGERKEIFEIHIKKVGRDPENSELKLDKLVCESVDYSGAEIEQVIQDALGNAFSDRKELSYKYLSEAIKRTKSLAVTRKKDIDEMRKRGQMDFRPASSIERPKTTTVKKKVARSIQTGGNE